MTDEQYNKLEDLIESVKQLTKWGPVGEEELDKVNFKEAARYRKDFLTAKKALEEAEPILEELR